MSVELCEVGRHVAPREDPRVHRGMERHDAVAEELAEPGQRLERGHGNPLVGERAGGAAAREDLDAQPLELARERGDTGLVVDRDQRAVDRHDAISSLTTDGSSRCSTACTRARSVSVVSPGSTATGSARITGPVSIPSSTQWTVAAVSGTPAARTSSMGWLPGNAGKRRRVGVHDAAAEDLEEPRTEQLHVPGEDEELDTALPEPPRERLVALLAARIVRGIEHGRRDAGRLGSLERPDARPVGRHRDDRQARVDQRLEIRPLTAAQDADHASLHSTPDRPASIRPMTRSDAPTSSGGTTAQ